jgi:hypothetical protein
VKSRLAAWPELLVYRVDERRVRKGAGKYVLSQVELAARHLTVLTEREAAWFRAPGVAMSAAVVTVRVMPASSPRR